MLMYVTIIRNTIKCSGLDCVCCIFSSFVEVIAVNPSLYKAYFIFICYVVMFLNLVVLTVRLVTLANIIPIKMAINVLVHERC